MMKYFIIFSLLISHWFLIVDLNFRERWEKVNVSFNPNGTVSYEPTKKFFFSRELSQGDESDIVLTLNIPLIVSII